jgi:hypothetical protein
MDTTKAKGSNKGVRLMIEAEDVKLIEASLEEFRIRTNILKRIGLIESLQFSKEDWALVYEVLDYVKQIVSGEYKNEALREIYLSNLLAEQKEFVEKLMKEAE